MRMAGMVLHAWLELLDLMNSLCKKIYNGVDSELLNTIYVDK